MRKPPVNMEPWRKSKDEIMTIALRKGWFSVPRFLYRAESMDQKCRELVKEGKLKLDRRHREADVRTLVYVPVREAPPAPPSSGA